MTTARKPLIAGNWKMNLTGAEASALADACAREASGNSAVDVAIAPPAIWLERVLKIAKDTPLKVWGQNAAEESSGAFTGETSFPMLLDAGATGALLGHSERRHVFGESNASVGTRAELGVRLQADVVVCVGEQLQDRKNGTTMDVVREQLEPILSSVPFERLTVAYEPVWAIGTGETATPEQAQETHAAIRALLVKTYGEDGESIRILYGGSVKPANAKELLSQADIDGVLVGGASLKPDSFAAIIAAANA